MEGDENDGGRGAACDCFDGSFAMPKAVVAGLSCVILPSTPLGQNGLVTAVGSGWASVIARCYGAASECKVLVK